jgi:hypothetical protein
MNVYKPWGVISTIILLMVMGGTSQIWAANPTGASIGIFNFNYAGIVNNIFEPASMLLMGTGLASIAGIARRRMKRGK